MTQKRRPNPWLGHRLPLAGVITVLSFHYLRTAVYPEYDWTTSAWLALVVGVLLTGFMWVMDRFAPSLNEAVESLSPSSSKNVKAFFVIFGTVITAHVLMNLDIGVPQALIHSMVLLVAAGMALWLVLPRFQ